MLCHCTGVQWRGSDSLTDYQKQKRHCNAVPFLFLTIRFANLNPAKPPRAWQSVRRISKETDVQGRTRGFRFPDDRGPPSASVAHSVTPMACHLSHGERLCGGFQKVQMHKAACGGSDSRPTGVPSVLPSPSPSRRWRATSPTGRGGAACGENRFPDDRGLPLHRTTIVLSVTCAEQILKHFYERCILGGTYFLLIHIFS